MVVKRVSSDHYMQLWRHLVDNREIIVTGSTYPQFIPPRPPPVSFWPVLMEHCVRNKCYTLKQRVQCITQYKEANKVQ